MAMTFQENIELSVPYFEYNIRHYPIYAASYAGLGRVYLLKGDIPQAITYLEKSVALSPKYKYYSYLIQAYLMQKDLDKAQRKYQEAQKKLVYQPFIDGLSKLFDQELQKNFPIDIGLK